MLQKDEIKGIIENDLSSKKKKRARKAQLYYEGRHDILDYRIFYYNSDGDLVEDTTRSNVKIPHPFFMELVDQAVQYILSGSKEGIVKSDIPELQAEMDDYFNNSEDFKAEFAETITGCLTKGFDYMYCYKNEQDRLAFMHADCLGVIEVKARYASDNREHVIYWYMDSVDIKGKQVKRIMDWDSENVFYYFQDENGNIEPDNRFKGKNVKPHVIYYKEGDDKTCYYENLGFVPFFRLDNNIKQYSDLRPVKPLIDDYDIMASSLSNNLIDFDFPIYVVRGFEGASLDELQQNLKTKKTIGTDEDTNSGVDIKTIDIPYEARKIKLELDEKNIYRFGFGLNTQGLKDTSATTNIAIKAAYSLLDLKKSKLEIRLMQFLRKLLNVVIDEINSVQGTDYSTSDVYFTFNPEIMSNAQENAQIKLIEAQEQQARITTLLNVSARLDDETLMQAICKELDIDYEKIRSKLPRNEEEDTSNAQCLLDSLDNIDTESGDLIEQKTKRGSKNLS